MGPKMSLTGSSWLVNHTSRLFAGVSVGRRSRQAKAALLQGSGEGWSFRLQSVETVVLPGELPAAQLLARALVEAIDQLLEPLQTPRLAIEAIGVLDAGPEVMAGRLAVELAQRTGVTVISEFSLADQALGGRGAPLSPTPDWCLFRSPKTTRLLVQLGASVQMTYLPAGGELPEVRCMDVGPGGDFLDGLVSALSLQRLPFDPTGHFAVQGRVQHDLLSHWASHPYFYRPAPKFIEPDDFGPRFIDATIASARDRRLTARDVLCSANHFIVRNLHEAVARHLPVNGVDEMLVSGGGMRNGFLWKLLQETFRPLPIRRMEEIGAPAEALRATHAAILAYLAIENLPANHPPSTGARQASPLGVLAPGANENWRRAVCHLADRLESGPKAA